MKYLLLMYHTETYWDDRTPERDEQEEAAFTEFCVWMQSQGITWDSHALRPLQSNQVRSFRKSGTTSQLLPEVTEVISGIFLLDVPDPELTAEILDRCPHIEGTRLEIREVDSES